MFVFNSHSLSAILPCNITATSTIVIISDFAIFPSLLTLWYSRFHLFSVCICVTKWQHRKTANPKTSLYAFLYLRSYPFFLSKNYFLSVADDPCFMKQDRTIWSPPPLSTTTTTTSRDVTNEKPFPVKISQRIFLQEQLNSVRHCLLQCGKRLLELNCCFLGRRNKNIEPIQIFGKLF